MMVNINLIRHGKTAGNLKNRYIGVTDESLCQEGIDDLLRENYPSAEVWFVSPMKRCLETAAVISGERQDFWTGKNRYIVPDFRECDFGLFENKNYRELSGCPQYQQWIDSGGTLPFPEGEAVEAFKERSCLAFEAVAAEVFEKGWHTANLVVHGGTIMSIMERYGVPRKDYYRWHVKNGKGYRIRLESGQWYARRELEDFVLL